MALAEMSSGSTFSLFEIRIDLLNQEKNNMDQRTLKKNLLEITQQINDANKKCLISNWETIQLTKKLLGIIDKPLYDESCGTPCDPYETYLLRILGVTFIFVSAAFLYLITTNPKKT